MPDSSSVPSGAGSKAPANGEPEFDVSIPHSARVWNYWLGGKDNFAADRAAGDAYVQTFPGIVDIARESRAFLGRGVRLLAGELGIRQFLDVGTGLPTADNTHEIAQRVAPEARIVYVDHDPIVLAHARALLSSAPSGATNYVHADLHDPDAVLQGASRTLDLDQPVALILSGVMGHVEDFGEALSIVSRLLAGLCPGSYLLLCDGTTGVDSAGIQAQDDYNASGAIGYHLRTPELIAQFFTELELAEPGVVMVTRWRLDPGTEPRDIDQYGGLGRKP